MGCIDSAIDDSENDSLLKYDKVYKGWTALGPDWITFDKDMGKS